MVRQWLFDLDDTLYSASTDFFTLVSRRITLHIAEQLNLPFDEARRLQKGYWQQYGTSLRGLILHHDFEAEAFFEFVHSEIPVETMLMADDQVRDMLLRCQGRRHVFTNSPLEYANRILAALNLHDVFENVFDIRAVDLIPKPHPAAYRKVLQSIGCSGEQCIMVDDDARNLITAREFGIRTVWLNCVSSETGRSLGSEEPLPADLMIGSLLDLEPTLQAAQW